MCTEQRFKKIATRLKLDKKVAVAVSGGSDSIALLLLTHSLIAEFKIDVTVLTVNHGLRAEAQLECNHVQQLATSIDLECHILKWEEPIAKQQLARDARYKMLLHWCKEHKVSQLLLGHHKNDQAETVLMRLHRGSGIDGLCAMKEISCKNGVNVIRPLLDFSKQELINYLYSKNITWCEDSSNRDSKYLRPTFRNYIDTLPNPEILINRITLTASHLQRTQQAINFYVKRAINECVTENKLGYVDICLSIFHSLPEEIASRVLLTCIMVIGNQHYKPRYKNFHNIFSQVWQERFYITHTLHGCQIALTQIHTLSIKREAKAISDIEFTIYPEKSVTWDNRFICKSKYYAKLCNNKKSTGIKQTLPVLQYKGEVIEPFTDQNFNLEFIFLQRVVEVLQ